MNNVGCGIVAFALLAISPNVALGQKENRFLNSSWGCGATLVMAGLASASPSDRPSCCRAKVGDDCRQSSPGWRRRLIPAGQALSGNVCDKARQMPMECDEIWYSVRLSACEI